MTPEQRERMEFYASRPKTQLAIAVRAALDEIEALRKDLEDLGAPVEPDAMCAELVKCGTFTEEAQKQREFISVEKSIYAELCKDRERLTWLLEKYDRYLHDDIWEKASETCPVDWDEAENVAKWGRVGIDALMTIDAIPEDPCRS